eukprot:5839851-Karenia_brevis.AAC.1
MPAPDVSRPAAAASGSMNLPKVRGSPFDVSEPLSKAPRLHLIDSAGKLTHNRKGYKLCTGWQTGECTETLP